MKYAAAVIAMGLLVAACGDDGGTPGTPSVLIAVDDHGDAIVDAMAPATNVGATSTVTLHLHNAGSSSTTGTLATSATGPFSIAPTSTCTGTLAAGATCDLVLTFAPTVAGAASGTLLAAATPGGEVAVALTGSGIAPSISVDPTMVTFDGASESQTVTLTNHGSGPSTLGTPTIDAVPWTLVSTTCTAALAAGASCDIVVGVTPGTLGGMTGALLVVIDGVVTRVPLITAPSLVAIDSHGDAIVSVMAPTTNVGDTSAVTIHLHNGGSLSRTGTIAMNVTGPFSIAPTSTCTGTLAAGATCDLVLTFAPTVAGAASGTLLAAATPGGEVTVALTGSGTVPSITVDPTMVVFDKVDVGTSDSQTVTLTNHGDGPSALGTPTVDTDLWSLVSTTCTATLAPGASCAIVVGVTPSAIGAMTGSLQLAIDGVVTSVPLTATGTTLVTVAVAGAGGGTITSSPAGISCGATCSGHFADVTLTATPAVDSIFTGWSIPSCTTLSCVLPASTTARTVTATFASGGLAVSPAAVTVPALQLGKPRTISVLLTNNSTGAQTYTKSLSGADYTFLQDLCAGTVKVGQQCWVTVQLKPSAVGAREGDLDILGGATHQHVALHGTGMSWVTIDAIGNPPETVVTSSVTGLTSCSTVCGAMSTSDVTFTAVPSTGVTLTGWSIAACGTSLTCTLPATAAEVTVRAVFSSTFVSPPIHIEPGAPVDLARRSVQPYPQSMTIVNTTGSAVTIDDVGCSPGNWSCVRGGCSTLAAHASCSAVANYAVASVVDHDESLFYADVDGTRYSVDRFTRFAAAVQTTVTGHGRVTGNGDIDCPGLCDSVVPDLDTFTFTAYPDPGYVLLGWDATDVICPATTLTCSTTRSVEDFSADPSFTPE